MRDRGALLARGLIVAGFGVLFFLLPHALIGDDHQRYADIELLLHHGRLSDSKFSLVMPLLSVPVLALGKVVKSSAWWAVFLAARIWRAGRSPSADAVTLAVLGAVHVGELRRGDRGPRAGRHMFRRALSEPGALSVHPRVQPAVVAGPAVPSPDGLDHGGGALLRCRLLLPRGTAGFWSLRSVHPQRSWAKGWQV